LRFVSALAGQGSAIESGSSPIDRQSSRKASGRWRSWNTRVGAGASHRSASGQVLPIAPVVNVGAGRMLAV
jgi:hypothetical protein